MIARLVVTLAAIALAGFLGAVHVVAPAHGLPALTLAGAGVTPFAVVFFFAHFAMGLDPLRSRRLRHVAPLVAAAAALPLALAAALAMVKSNPEGVAPPLAPGLLVAILCGGAAVMTTLGVAATRWGVGNGYLLVQVAAGLGVAPDPWAVVGGVVLALLFAPLVHGRLRVRGQGWPFALAFARAPGGLGGLSWGLGFATLIPSLVAPYPGAEGLVAVVRGPLVQVPLAVVMAGFFTFFQASFQTTYFVARHTVGEAAAMALAQAPDRTLTRATALNAGVVGALAGSTIVFAPAGLDLATSAWIGAALATLALDLRDEARAPADLVELGEAPRLLEADRLRDALTAAGIPSHVRCAHGWQVLGGLWAFVPLPLLVPRADAERARALLEREAPFLVGSPTLTPTVAP